jgi:hypothetical protein
MSLQRFLKAQDVQHEIDLSLVVAASVSFQPGVCRVVLSPLGRGNAFMYDGLTHSARCT